MNQVLVSTMENASQMVPINTRVFVRVVFPDQIAKSEIYQLSLLMLLNDDEIKYRTCTGLHFRIMIIVYLKLQY